MRHQSSSSPGSTASARSSSSVSITSPCPSATSSSLSTSAPCFDLQHDTTEEWMVPQSQSQSSPSVAHILGPSLVPSANLWAYATQTLLNRVAFGYGAFYRPSQASQCFKCGEYLYNLDVTSVMPRCTNGGIHYIDDVPLWRLPPVGDQPTLTSVAVDCEMVLTEHGSELAHMVVLDGSSGLRLASWFVQPRGRVIDLLTMFSGITSLSQIQGPSAIPFDQVFRHMAALGMTEETFIIGHGLESDFRALRLEHEHHVIDTAILYPSVCGHRQKLKTLAKFYLAMEIQLSNHDPAEDAYAALMLMYVYSFAWFPRHETSVFLETASRHFRVPLHTRQIQVNPNRGRNRRSQASKKMVSCHACGMPGHKKSVCSTLTKGQATSLPV